MCACVCEGWGACSYGNVRVVHQSCTVRSPIVMTGMTGLNPLWYALQHKKNIYVQVRYYTSCTASIERASTRHDGPESALVCTAAHQKHA
jgi:hypothetical protein